MAMNERYICKLSEEMKNRASEELNEPTTDQLIHDAIDQLKTAYNEDIYGKLVNSNDHFLLRFLRAKKFNQQKALACLQNYHKIRREYTEVFDKLKTPVLLKPMIDKMVLYMLPGKASDGAAVMLYRPGLLNKEVNMHDVLAYSVMSIEKLLEDEQVQICGLRTLEDYHNFNISVLMQISISELVKMNNIWMEAMPIRYKAAHLINEGKIYDVIIAMMRPFMKKKMLDRIKVHGSNYLSVHDYIDRSLLPPYLGGTGPDPNEGGKLWNEILTENWTHDTAL